MGTVFLIGAGPGDPGLITDKGKKLLKSADVIIYDRLIENSLLNHAREDCETIYAGKKPEEHKLTQQDINELMVEKAEEVKRVVRLKGGDPFLFGRGGEEAEHLKKKGVDYQVVPGITSALGVPAYAGIPATSRDASSSVAIITGHEDPDKEESSHDWKSLARGPETLIFLMGVNNLPNIQERLLKYGRKRETPAAIIERGTMPEQHSVISTLGEIVQEAQEEEISPPAVIIIGEVVKKGFEWRDEMPLAGVKIINTRPKGQARGFTEMLEEEGAVVREVPAIKIEPPADHNDLDGAIQKIGSYDWIIFTSINGVRYFFERFSELERDIRDLGGVKLAAIGEKTAKALKNRGLRVELVPEEYRAEALLEELKVLDEEKKILLPRTTRARDVLREGLEKEGLEVDEVETYRTLSTSLHEDVKRDLEDGKYDLITFTSSSTVENFLGMLGDKNYLKDMTLAAIGPVTASTAEEEGLSVDIVASEYDIEGLYEAILDYYGGG